MKNKLFLLALAIGMVGCYDVNVERKQTDYVIRGGNNPLTIVVVDSCEYLHGEWGNATVLTHKGNCNNPIHKHNGGNNE
jgi:hypothetical protein